MTRRTLLAALGSVLALLLVGSCGDTTSDLITRAGDSVSGCTSDEDCDSSLPYCEDGRCVVDDPSGGCESSDQCSEPTAHCDTGSGVCRGCLEVSHCGVGQICVLPLGSCAEPCRVGECPTANPVCDETDGYCRGCVNASECPEELPVCNATSGRCVECATSDECDGEEPFCDGGRCVECLEPGHCEEQGDGCSPVGKCAIPCVSQSNCSLFDEPICDGSGYCVECLSPADCDDGEACLLNECEDVEEGEEDDDEREEGED